MASLARLLGNGLLGTPALLHPRETLFKTFNLSAINTEDVIDVDGCASVVLDLRGTFSGTIEVAGTVDGTNWTPIPVRPLNQASKLYVASVVGAVPGVWVGSCAGFRRVRARATAWTSGTVTIALAANLAAIEQGLEGLVTSNLGVATGVASAAVTLTLASPGAGLRHYLTYLTVERHASALLTAAATPVIVTTTNLPGSLAFSIPVEAAAQGTVYEKRRDFPSALASSAQNTATTIVCPVYTGVIWRVEAGFYVAP
jgi:hypothetical protein